jgi:class 3 adenylate cyclase
VGINVGDVIVEPHDIFGDGVNIAARLESIAEPGGICISSAAYDHVRGKVELETADLAAEARRAENAPRPDAMDLFFQGRASSTRGRPLRI